MSGQTSNSSGSEARSARSRTRSGRTESRSVVRRYFRRRTTPLGWWPGGLLPLLGLCLLFLWGLVKTAPDIQERTRASVAALLQDSGYDGLDVSVDGQRVLVSGSVPTAEVARIRSIARGATCDTFVADDLVCPTTVSVNVAGTSGMDEVAEEAEHRTHNFRFVRSESGLMLQGDVPSQAVRDKLLADANNQFDTVIDSLTVTGEDASVSLEWATDKAMPFLAGIVTGGVAWTDGKLSAWGRTSDALANLLRDSFTSGPFPDRIGEIRLQSSEAVAECNKQLSSVLAQSTINFLPGRAEISAESQEVLRRLAGLAQSCPGNLDVEGHTDNIGTASSNLDLSQQRADAIVEALSALGVDRSRLTARGFGEAQPLRSNRSSTGRAQNRRIEIKVADFN